MAEDAAEAAEKVPETPGPAKDPIEPAEEPKPAHPEGFNWVRSLAAGAVLTALSSILERVVELFSPETVKTVKELNDSFVAKLNLLDPWNLILTYGSYLIGAAGEHSSGGIWYYLTGQFISAGNIRTLWRIIPGAFYTAGVIWSQGWVNIITAAISLVIGYFILKDSDGPFLFKFIGVPAIGCVCVWLLLKVVMLASYCLGGMIDGVGIFSWIGYFFSFLFHLVATEREHHYAGILLHRLKL